MKEQAGTLVREKRSDTGAGQKVHCRLSGRKDEELNNICKKGAKEIDGCSYAGGDAGERREIPSSAMFV